MNKSGVAPKLFVLGKEGTYIAFALKNNKKDVSLKTLNEYFWKQNPFALDKSPFYGQFKLSTNAPFHSEYSSTSLRCLFTYKMHFDKKGTSMFFTKRLGSISHLN
jgi:hypothetical protein